MIHLDLLQIFRNPEKEALIKQCLNKSGAGTLQAELVFLVTGYSQLFQLKPPGSQLL